MNIPAGVGLRENYMMGWRNGSRGTGIEAPGYLSDREMRAYRAGYDAGERDRKDAEQVASELYGSP